MSNSATTGTQQNNKQSCHPFPKEALKKQNKTKQIFISRGRGRLIVIFWSYIDGNRCRRPWSEMFVVVVWWEQRKFSDGSEGLGNQIPQI